MDLSQKTIQQIEELIEILREILKNKELTKENEDFFKKIHRDGLLEILLRGK